MKEVDADRGPKQEPDDLLIVGLFVTPTDVSLPECESQ
ncbi:MAG: hypothetical protein OJF51_000237 [Nitrospira sp.]|nr:MAG: hypothetical protein OJF51_000237 [Nitrospira sp.]